MTAGRRSAIHYAKIALLLYLWQGQGFQWAGAVLAIYLAVLVAVYLLAAGQILLQPEKAETWSNPSWHTYLRVLTVGYTALWLGYPVPATVLFTAMAVYHGAVMVTALRRNQ